MAPQTVRIFLSSPGDVADERQRARLAIEQLGRSHLLRNRVHLQLVAWDDPHAATPFDARESPQHSVNRFNGRPADCDLTIIILWGRIGTPLPAFTRPDGTPYESGTVWEYEDARAANRPVFIYRRTATPRVEPDDRDLSIKRAQYRAVHGFIASLGNAGINEYETLDEFSLLVRQHLEAFVNERLEAAASTGDSGRGARRVPFLAPDLPSGFVARPREFDALLALVLRPDQTDPTRITTALHGSGGYGKTSLATALCHDERVKAAFPDGVLWTSLGQAPSLLDELAKWCGALTGEGAAFADVPHATARLAEVLGTRRCLLVIDDVWNRAHLDPFLRGGPHCARLVTTRRVDLLEEAPRLQVDEMQPAEAQQLLASAFPRDTVPRRALDALAARLGEWPLLLALARGMIRARLKRGDSIDGALTFTGRLLDKGGVTAFDARDASRREDTVRRTVAASREQLDAEDERRFLDLAVFPEDAGIPLTTLERLWQLDDVDADECARRLDDVALVSLNLGRRVVTLHDMMTAYLRREIEDARPIHARLVSAYGDPMRLPDAYAWRWLPHHLRQADQLAQLRPLLLDPGWLQAQLHEVGPHAQLEGFDGVRDDELQLVRAALRLAVPTLAIDPSQFCEQLLGRLPAETTVDLERFRARLEETAPLPRLRARWPNLVGPGSLVQTLPHGDLVSGALPLPQRRLLSWSVDGRLCVWDVESGEGRPLGSHGNPVRGALLLADGRVLSWSDAATLQVWDVATGEGVALTGHEGKVDGALLLPDGRALSWSADGTLRTWDLTTGESRPLTGHARWVTGALLLPDGRVLSWSADGTLRTWDLATGESRPLTGHQDVVSDALMLPDGRVLSWSVDGTLRVWDLATGEARPLTGHQGRVTGALLLPDRRVLSWSRDSTVRVWDLATGEGRPLTGHAGRVVGALVLPHERVLTWSADGTLRVWSAATDEGRLLTGHGDSVNGALPLPDGRLLSWSLDRTLRVWNLTTGAAAVLTAHQSYVKGASLLPDGRVLSWGGDGTLRVWDVMMAERRPLTGHGNAVNGARLLPGERVLSWSWDGTLQTWDLATGEGRPLTGHQSSVNGASLLPDQRVLSWSRDSTLRVWDLATGEGRALSGHTDAVHGALLLLDQRVLSWSEDATLRVWDLATREGRPLTGHVKAVNGALLLPDGRVLSWSSDRTLRVWDAATGEGRALIGHQDVVDGAVLLPDGRVLSWGLDWVLGLWDVATGEALALSGHEDAVHGALPLPDGRVLSWSRDRTLRVWDLTTGETRALSGHTDAVDGALRLPDGRVLSWSWDGTLRVWDLATGEGRPLTVHQGEVNGALLLPDGCVLSWGRDRCLRRQSVHRREPGEAFFFDVAVTTVLVTSPGRFFVGDTLGRVHFLELAAAPFR